MNLAEWVKKPQTVKKIFPVVNGLFTHIDFDFEVDKQLLDILFVGNYGEKNPSPFVEAIQDEYDQELTQNNLRTIGAALLALYANKWARLKEVGKIEYDPIHNYLDEWEDHNEGSESKEDELSSTRTDTLNTTETTNSTRTDNLLKTETINESEVSNNSQADAIYGFNSTQSSPTDTSSGNSTKTTTGSNSVADTGTQGVAQTVADTGSNTRAFEQADNFSGSDTRDRNGRHSGNIGNLTSQKMINEEIELWRWTFINNVLDDVKEFCTLPIYLKNRH